MLLGSQIQSGVRQSGTDPVKGNLCMMASVSRSSRILSFATEQPAATATTNSAEDFELDLPRVAELIDSALEFLKPRMYRVSEYRV